MVWANARRTDLKKKTRLAGIGIVAVAIVIALAVMGTGYGMWLDTVVINHTVNVGNWGGSLSNPAPTGGAIVLSTNLNVLTVMMTNAQSNTTYSGTFNVNNTGTVPVKFQSITPGGVPAGVVISIGGVAPGTQIDPGETKPATITVSNAGGSFNFTETIVLVVWNQ
jgi:hypothetical protein